PTRAMRRAAVARNELGWVGFRTDLRRFRQRLFQANASGQFAAIGILLPRAILRGGGAVVHVARRRAEARANRRPRVKRLFHLVTVVLALFAGASAFAQEAPVVNAPAGSVRGESLGDTRVFRGI